MLVTDLNKRHGLLGSALLELKAMGHRVFVFEDQRLSEDKPITFGVIEGPYGLGYIESSGKYRECIDIRYYAESMKGRESSRMVVRNSDTFDIEWMEEAQRNSFFLTHHDHITHVRSLLRWDEL